MFEQQKSIADATVFAKRDQLLLQAEPGCVINGAELEDGDQILSRGFRRSKRIQN
jgi:hypothetical protein